MSNVRPHAKEQPVESPRLRLIRTTTLVVLGHALACLALAKVLDLLKPISSGQINSDFWDIFLFAMISFSALGLMCAQIALIAMWAATSRLFLTAKLGLAVLVVVLWFGCIWLGRVSDVPYDQHWGDLWFSEFLPLDPLMLGIWTATYFAAMFAMSLSAAYYFRVRLDAELISPHWHGRMFQVGIRDLLCMMLLVGVGIVCIRILNGWLSPEDYVSRLLMVGLPLIHAVIAGPLVIYSAHHELRNRPVFWRLAKFLAVGFTEAIVLILFMWILEGRRSDPYDIQQWLHCGIAAITLTAAQIFIIHRTLRILRNAGVRIDREPTRGG